MARKANISREEIHLACWELIEKNLFPNIPRLTEHFFTKDGRRCSNTTFMKAISEWEEAYKEHQQNQLHEIDNILLPVFKRFAREAAQNLGQLLDEKATDVEQHHKHKQDATEGGYLSLSSALIELQDAHEKINAEHQTLLSHAQALQQKLDISEQRYLDVLSQNQVLNSQLKEEQKSSTELRMNLSQKEVDLAKQDNQLEFLKHENEKLLKQHSNTMSNHAKDDTKKWQDMTKKLDALATSIQTIHNKDRGSKK
ncbi:hypothetical protein [Marinomonas profundimaris]|uniref:KfrA N-terminal DNA-binding domain-containing protein n=1 Tax=Marinomonas profundimaris TaxID=1208321 RepID=W1RNN3_9GAMM|nr:hypothetical protein [Marinomonas profundimaris]ETI58042.1 hypothetical protein D104_17050 [Marinomonas profundimaris]